MSERAAPKNISQKIMDGAKVLVQILEVEGPLPRTGATYFLEKHLGQRVSQREFADMVQFVRRTIALQTGRTVIWNPNTNQYGFPDDVQEVEKYIILRNSKYAATRAETMAAVCDAGMAQHGSSFALMMAKGEYEGHAQRLRAMSGAWESELKVERAAMRTGAEASVQLEERLFA